MENATTTAERVLPARTASASLHKIWIVMRSQGEYSDRSVSCVCWFPSKVAAETFISKAQPQSRDAAQRWRIFEDANLETSDADVEKFRDGLIDRRFDPTGWDADGVYYFLSEIERGTVTVAETATPAAGA